ncbi:hypothetical protein [Xanthomonas translucens]|uniref:hypothetical protein n=2 Tax=Xanthomonas campestris pv. translucens TaxID=343 RepID=UPI0006424AD3|nr:hypothetical protein [Xanthomonas translucens]AKK67255.1 hypothetical protein FD63_07040 [Xanthomonas translucens pv. undulosa]AVY67336.1 hypothetical protein NZ30_13740 [Xanthomonas translucens pv. undulosa]MCT8269739.1 hypothetical protein [Xanthomonas translucens pv. undulosa]MCT8280717.1 hypothetical protein [Xanthomonas translucens pv. undulosa]QSQ40896.1 hypothetical protein ISN33_14935 [Xanthomonas translucens pv. translucens]
MQHGSMIEQQHRCRHINPVAVHGCAHAAALRNARAGHAGDRAMQRISASFARCSGSHRRGADAGASLALSHPPAIGAAAILQ